MNFRNFTEEHFTSIVNTKERWTTLCSLLDDNDYWKLFATQINVPASTIQWNTNLSSTERSPSRELLHRWRLNKTATTSKLLEILTIISHIDAVLLIQTWINDEYVLSNPHTSHRIENASELYNKGMNCFWKSCDELAMEYFQQAADLNHPLAMLRLCKYYAKDENKNQFIKYYNKCILFKDWFVQQAETGNAEAQYYLGLYLEVMEGADGSLWERQSADQGFAPAQNLIACRLEEAEDMEAAVEWYQKAADQGFMLAQYNIGLCYQDGTGVPQDAQLAIEWFHKAAQQGNISAQCSLGSALEKARHWEQAAYWYRVAAEQGYAIAQTNLGLCYEYGTGVPRDYEAAVYWYTQAAYQGNTSAQYYLGCYYENEATDFPKAFEWYLKAAEKDHIDAQVAVGWFLQHGTGIQVDPQQAFSWFLKAADQGSDEGQYQVGLCHEHGDGVAKNFSLALEWYHKAAQCGHTDAQHRLGLIFLYGAGGVKQDVARGIKWIRKASESGDDQAQLRYASLLHEGKFIPQDDKMAAYWYHTAAMSDNTDAMYYLGQCYYQGIGVKQDFDKAFYWFKKCVDQGNDIALCSLARCFEFGTGVDQSLEEAILLLCRSQNEEVLAELARIDLVYEVARCPKEETADDGPD